MAPIVPPERRDRARQYRRIQYRLSLISFAVAALYLVVLTAGGSLWLGRVVTHPVLYVVALFLGLALVELPADYYGHLQARRFGLSIQRTRSWLADQAKSFLLSLLFQGALAYAVLSLWSSHPDTWFLWAAVIAVAGDLVIVFLFPVLVMPLFHKYSPLGDGELKERLLALSERSGVGVKGVFVSDVSRKQTSLNAALTGIGSTRRMILFDTMIQSCSPDEIEVVMGHELGHHYHGHIAKRTVATALFIGAAFLVAGYAVEPLSVLLGLGGLTKEALPLLGGLFILLGLPLVPALMALSRSWERDCDAFALKMTGKPEAFVSFFQKVADRNLADLHPPRWVYYFQYSHPPVLERIAMAERWPR